jgi:hypothetical protein
MSAHTSGARTGGDKGQQTQSSKRLVRKKEFLTRFQRGLHNQFAGANAV